MAPRSCDQPDPAAAREPCQLSAWPDRKIITGSNRTLRTCAIYPPIGAMSGPMPFKTTDGTDPGILYGWLGFS